MTKNSGIIYDLGDSRFGLAIHSEQHENFTRFNKVYLHIFTDRLCTIPQIDDVTGKKYVTLKHSSKIKAIGFAD
jgi:hypothetical protein